MRIRPPDVRKAQTGSLEIPAFLRLEKPFKAKAPHTSQPTLSIPTSVKANVGMYRESQISLEKSNFGLHRPNNPLTISRNDIKKSPSASYLENFRKVQKFGKKIQFLFIKFKLSSNFKETVRARRRSR